MAQHNPNERFPIFLRGSEANFPLPPPPEVSLTLPPLFVRPCLPQKCRFLLRDVVP